MWMSPTVQQRLHVQVRLTPLDHRVNLMMFSFSNAVATWAIGDHFVTKCIQSACSWTSYNGPIKTDDVAGAGNGSILGSQKLLKWSYWSLQKLLKLCRPSWGWLECRHNLFYTMELGPGLKQHFAKSKSSLLARGTHTNVGYALQIFHVGDPHNPPISRNDGLPQDTTFIELAPLNTEWYHKLDLPCWPKPLDSSLADTRYWRLASNKGTCQTGQARNIWKPDRRQWARRSSTIGRI